MFCPECGKEVKAGDLFCENCGTKLEFEVDSVEESPVDKEINENKGNEVENTKAIEKEEPIKTTTVDNPVPIQQDNAFIDMQSNADAATNVGNVYGNTSDNIYGSSDYSTTFSASNGSQPVGMSKVDIPKKDKSFWILVTEALLAVIAIVVFYKVGSGVFSDESIALRYATDMLTGDYADAYSLIDLDESEFINEQMFIDSRLEPAVSLVGIDVKNNEKSKFSSEVELEYREEGSGTTKQYDVSLNKKKDHNFLIFDNWAVAGDKYVVSDFTIIVPQDASVTLDGVQIGDTYSKQNDEYIDEGYVTYGIPSLFSGKHLVAVSMEGFEGSSEEIVINENSQVYEKESVTISSEEQENLIKKAYDNIGKLYEAKLSKGRFSEVSALFSPDSTVQKEAKEAYESFADDAATSKDDGGVTGIDFSNVYGSFNGTEIDDGKIYAYISLEYDYLLKHNDRTSWFYWSDEDIEYEEDQTDGNNEFDVCFVYENGEWLQCSTQMPGVYYY